MNNLSHGYTGYHAKLYANELSRRYPSCDMKGLMPALMGSRVDLNPHQIDAALFAFRSPLSHGAILADEVGLGKTIEAGIVLAQKWAERKRAVLIIVPASLRTQWNQELWEKFALPSVILERKLFDTLQKAGHSNPFKSEIIIIVSYAFARKHTDLLKRINWDLVVIDEAHRLRNVYKSGKSIAKDLKQALSHAPKILLTATPLQNTLLELYGLVSFIDEHVFSDIRSFRANYSRPGEEAFARLKERLAPLCKRTLRRQVLEYVRYTERRAYTQDFTLSPAEEELYEMMSDYLCRERLWALPSGPNPLVILVLRKLLASSSYAIAGALRTMLGRLDFILHNYKEWKNDQEITDLSDEIYNDFEASADFVEEEAASYGSPGLTKHHLRDEKAIREEHLLLQQMLLKAEGIRKNAKGSALIQALRTGLEMTANLGGQAKAIIFTESKRTQNYLYELLGENGYSGQVLLFNGSNSDKRAQQIYKEWQARHRGSSKVTGSKDVDMRAALVEEFRERASIMIATEAASEGINLQFCSLVINYDLPWNPQRIEQRIGRCHRYGQQHDVVVVNFLNSNNAADKRVFEILSEKFRLFDGVFGASDEVLGSIESGVDFERRIAEIYQTCRTSNEIEASFDELQASFSQEIEEGLMQAKQKLLENFDTEVAEKLQVYKAEAAHSLHRLEVLLWELTRFTLPADFAVYDEAAMSFNLSKAPNNTIPTGIYALKPTEEHEHHYHAQHPLAQTLITRWRSISLEPKELIFQLSGAPKGLKKNISILSELAGQSGTLAVRRFSLNSLDAEDHILFAGQTDAGQLLDQEQMLRLFDLSAQVKDLPSSFKFATINFEKQFAEVQAKILNQQETRNNEYFDEEIEKLDNWAEDARADLKLALREADDEIKELKREARTASNLQEKVRLQKEVKTLQQNRDELWRNYDQAAKEVERQKDRLLDETEARLELHVEQEELFTIKWKLV